MVTLIKGDGNISSKLMENFRHSRALVLHVCVLRMLCMHGVHQAFYQHVWLIFTN